MGLKLGHQVNPPDAPGVALVTSTAALEGEQWI